MKSTDKDNKEEKRHRDDVTDITIQPAIFCF